MCPRCFVTPPQLCCDLCHPADFENKFIVSLKKRKAQPHRSTIKPYKPSEDDKALRKRLNRWRWEMANDLYGEPFTDNFGCYTFMTNQVLDCICDAAHYSLVTSIDALAREARWYLSKEHGQTVIDIILEMQPASPPPPPQQTMAAATPKVKSRELTCSSCSQVGHSSAFFRLVPI